MSAADRVDDGADPSRDTTKSKGSNINDMLSEASAPADPMVRDGITSSVLAGYAVGHFANDLCASMWFIYLSYYLLNVV